MRSVLDEAYTSDVERMVVEVHTPDAEQAEVYTQDADRAHTRAERMLGEAYTPDAKQAEVASPDESSVGVPSDEMAQTGTFAAQDGPAPSALAMDAPLALEEQQAAPVDQASRESKYLRLSTDTRQSANRHRSGVVSLRESYHE